MIRHVEDTVNKYIDDLRKVHPGLAVELRDNQSPWVDARLHIRCSSHEQVGDVFETIAHLTTKFYLDEGVYIMATASFSGPV